MFFKKDIEWAIKEYFELIEDSEGRTPTENASNIINIIEYYITKPTRNAELVNEIAATIKKCQISGSVSPYEELLLKCKTALQSQSLTDEEMRKTLQSLYVYGQFLNSKEIQSKFESIVMQGLSSTSQSN